MSATGADAGLPSSPSATPSPSASLVASRKAKRDEDRERRRNRIRRNSLQLLVSATGFHQYGEINVADRNGGFVEEPESGVTTTEPGSVSAAARLLMRAFNNRPRPTGDHEPDSEDGDAAMSGENSSHLRGGGFPSGFSFTPDGETLNWSEESDTTDGNLLESDPNAVFDDKVDEEELSRDIDETVEEIVGDLFDGDTTMSDSMRQQTKMRLRDHLLGQELARMSERRMRRGGAVGGNAGHQGHYKNSPRNVVFPIKTFSPVVPDGGHGYQYQTPDASLCYPLQWRMFYGSDSNWVAQGRHHGLYTDNSAAANNEKQWASERSTTLAKNYTAFNGQGYDGEMEGYPLQASVDLFGSEARPLTLAPRDAELLSALDPATSVRYAFEHSRMSLRAQSQSQRGQTLFRFKPEDSIDSSLSVNPDTPSPTPQGPLQAAATQPQSEIDAQLLGEAAALWDARGNANKGFHDGMESQEKPPFPISPPLPGDYNPFAQFAPQQTPWANERTSFPMSPVPSADRLFHGNPTSVWQGRNLFEGFGAAAAAAAEPVALQSMENQKSPFPLSPPPDLDDAHLTPSEPSTPSSIFGPSAAVATNAPAAAAAAAAAKKQNEAWARGPIPGLPARPAPVTPPSQQQRVDKTKTTTPVTPDTTQDVVSTMADREREAARFRPVASPGGQDAPPYGSITGGGIGEDTTAYPAVTTPSSLGDRARVRMPTVPRTRRVADRAIRAARRKISFAGRGRKPGY